MFYRKERDSLELATTFDVFSIHYQLWDLLRAQKSLFSFSIKD